MGNRHAFTIGDHALCQSGDLFVIAEAGLAHEGSLGTAMSMIDAAADCDADAIKFQTHLAEHESTLREKFRVPVFPQDATRQDYWQRTGFDAAQWKLLAEYAERRGILFLSSPFSNQAVELLDACGVPAWKVASGELTNYPMLKLMCQTGKPILVSSGMSSWQELESTLRYIESLGGTFGVFQCTTAYPCPAEKWGLNIVDELLHRFDCPVGLSDHSGTITPSIAAVAKGATMLEVHLTFSKQQFGPDAQASLTIEQLAQLVEAVRALKCSIDHPIEKDNAANQFSDLHRLFTKSVVASRRLPKGHRLSEFDLSYKKPGDGIPANEFESLIGKTLKRAVDSDHFFSLNDFVE